jgi:hypothetical protein
MRSSFDTLTHIYVPPSYPKKERKSSPSIKEFHEFP